MQNPKLFPPDAPQYSNRAVVVTPPVSVAANAPPQGQKNGLLRAQQAPARNKTKAKVLSSKR